MGNTLAQTDRNQTRGTTLPGSSRRGIGGCSSKGRAWRSRTSQPGCIHQQPGHSNIQFVPALRGISRLQVKRYLTCSFQLNALLQLNERKSAPNNQENGGKTLLAEHGPTAGSLPEYRQTARSEPPELSQPSFAHAKGSVKPRRLRK